MASITQRPKTDYVGRLLTLEDLQALPSELPSGSVTYELDNGILLMMSPTGDPHGAVQSNLATELKVQGERRGYGKARTEVGVVLWRNPDRVVSPDVFFIANDRLPVRTTREGYLESIPNIVAEVRSKNDTRAYLQRKVDDYLSVGVELVWVADPESSTVTVHRKDQQPLILRLEQTLTAEPIIPGFSLPLAELFRQ